LSGKIPNWLGIFQELGELDLSYNNFSGKLPSEIGNCSNLLKLSLHHNNLSGEIPQEIGNLTSLNVFNIQSNSLNGHIPSTIQQCKKLYELRLSQNFLTGTIPFELGELDELQVILDLSKNLFTGEIPSSLGNLMKLERLNISFNQLQGKVPTSLGKLTSLHVLNLSNNHLEGQIPSTLSGFPRSSFLNNNRLCGSPLVSCSGSTSQGKMQLSNTQVAVIIVAIVFTSTVICLVMLYIMLRIWCNWRKVSISNDADGGNIAMKKEESRWVCNDQKTRNGEYWNMNSFGFIPSPDKNNSVTTTCFFNIKMEAMENANI
jgi:hypothetical protein